MIRLSNRIIIGLLVYCTSAAICHADQSMPALIANHETKECATMFTGDECMSCSEPEGWEVLGNAYSGKCPKNYTVREKEVPGVCKGMETPFCCTVMHSGFKGDCTNVVVNEKERTCAFVENLKKCKQLPQGWEKAKNQGLWGTVCPSIDYEWLNSNLNCGKE